MKFFPLIVIVLWIFTQSADLLPNSGSSDQDKAEPEIAGLFQALDRQSAWEMAGSKLLHFQTYHTQGMTVFGDIYFLSTVEILERTQSIKNHPHYDRTPGRGTGHLIAFNQYGEKTGSLKLGEGDIYHPGGIDRDEDFIWVPVAEYRPNSRSIIYRVDPEKMEAEEVFRVPDHIGALVRDTDQNRLIGFSWGARRIYSWPLDESLKLAGPENPGHQQFILNPQHYTDYQDCQFLGDGQAICSGVLNYRGSDGSVYTLGGIDLIDLVSFKPVWQIPVDLFTDGSNPRVMTQNPFYAEISDWGLLFHFIPEDDKSRHFVFEVREE